MSIRLTTVPKKTSREVSIQNSVTQQRISKSGGTGEIEITLGWTKNEATGIRLILPPVVYLYCFISILMLHWNPKLHKAILGHATTRQYIARIMRRNRQTGIGMSVDNLPQVP
mmetsp:Transcript_21771/g.31783  ORF Transcript_21771/g.31783 Transcript_21771/m.31783 type:complete len:113 (+) Transcript_21771:1916-2254(+)